MRSAHFPSLNWDWVSLWIVSSMVSSIFKWRTFWHVITNFNAFFNGCVIKSDDIVASYTLSFKPLILVTLPFNYWFEASFLFLSRFYFLIALEPFTYWIFCGGTIVIWCICFSLHIFGYIFTLIIKTLWAILILIVSCVHHVAVELICNIFNSISNKAVFIILLTLINFLFLLKGHICVSDSSSIANTAHLERFKVFRVIFTTPTWIIIVWSAAYS